MLEQLPIAATGHTDGSVRFWTVREPQTGAVAGASAGAAPNTLPSVAAPAALSRLPVRSHFLPAWELSELRGLRLERPEGVATSAVTSVCVGEGYDKFFWTADASGGVRSWRVPAADAAAAAAAAASSAAAASDKPPPPGERASEALSERSERSVNSSVNWSVEGSLSSPTARREEDTPLSRPSPGL